ncbi:hypothetical protein C0993_010998 [Termitomyces sp. T159_Od127]|nr:hypothetical protein C0993_010998 [Termitomyces sp. T159_Od127]
MGRWRLYNTPEEQRLAANAKSRRSYHKFNLVGKRLPAFRPLNLDKPQDPKPQDPERDNPRHVLYWSVRAERVARKLTKIVGDSPINYLESLYNNFVTSQSSEAIFDAIVGITKLEKWITTYQHEILQLAGAGVEWKRAEEVYKAVSVVLRSLEDLEMYTTLEGTDFSALHKAKEFAFQNLLG